MGYSLFRRGKIFQCRFKVAGRPRVQISTHETSRVKADLVASRAYEAAVLRSRGDEPVPTLSGLVALWLGAHALTASAAHLKSVEVFGRLHFGELGPLRLYEITTAAVETARAKYLEDHAPASANGWLITLRLLFGWAIRRRMIRVRDWDVKLLKVQKKPRVMLPVAKTTLYVDTCDELVDAPSLQMVLRLALGLGLRESEALGARWEWLDMERENYTPGDTKGREAVPMPIPKWLVDYLRPRLKPQGWMAPSPTGEPYSAGTLWEVMKKVNKRLALKGLTPHRLRGTYATLLSEAGVPPQDIQRIMRHKNIQTTMAYLEVDMERVRRGQVDIAKRTGMAGRESGAPTPAEPHQFSEASLQRLIQKPTPRRPE